MNKTDICIAADSAADLLTLDDVPFSVASLKIITDERQFVDESGLDIPEMVDYLAHYKGKSSSSCPAPGDWLAAFGEAETVFGVTLTSGLSGCHNAAQIAKQMYEQEHPGRKVYLIDSLSAGPGEQMLVEKFRELTRTDLSPQQIYEAVCQYQQQTGLLFILESLTNFANNGRINPAIAKMAGLLGINIIGQASKSGTLEPLGKHRGFKRSAEALVKLLEQNGFAGGKLYIGHCLNEAGAARLQEMILARFPSASVQIYPLLGLCSYYAEKGGLLVGYEKF